MCYNILNNKNEGKNLLNYYIIKSNNVERDSFIWNLIGSTLNSFQSIIMLVFITRITNLIDAGIFSIAYTNSILLLNIGKFGMRNFQVSDITEEFNFFEYKFSRYLTTATMLIVSIIYIFFTYLTHNYSINKVLITFILCVYKSTDSIEDVYHGLYQKKGRLDIR